MAPTRLRISSFRSPTDPIGLGAADAVGSAVGGAVAGTAEPSGGSPGLCSGPEALGAALAEGSAPSALMSTTPESAGAGAALAAGSVGAEALGSGAAVVLISAEIAVVVPPSGTEVGSLFRVKTTPSPSTATSPTPIRIGVTERCS